MAVWLSFGPVAHASGNHHSAALSGRSALMGGTGVALGVDGAAPFLNPATVARIGDRRIAFSTRFFRYAEYDFEGFHHPDGVDTAEFGPVELGDTDVERREIRTVPDTSCLFLSTGGNISSNEPRARAGRQRLALCLARTEDTDFSLRALNFSDQSAGRRFDQNSHFTMDWYRFSAGPTWGAYFTDDLAIGGSLFVTRSKYQHTLVASSVVEDTVVGMASASTYESLLHAYSWDLVTSIGVTYHLSDVISVGTSLRVPFLHILGRARTGYLAAVDAEESTRRQWAAEGDFTARPPVQLGLGLGAEWRMVRLEADAFLTAGQSQYAHGNLDRDEIFFQSGQVTSRTASLLRLEESSNSVLNVGVGAEVFVGPRLGVLGGAQTDVNALPELDPAQEETRFVRTRLNYYRAGAGISSYTDFGDLVLGARFDYGSGAASAVNTLLNPPALRLSDVREIGVLIVIAGTVNWGSIREAAGQFKDVVGGESPPRTKQPPEPMLTPKK